MLYGVKVCSVKYKLQTSQLQGTLCFHGLYLNYSLKYHGLVQITSCLLYNSPAWVQFSFT